jgi:RNA polymerase sigma factor (sigma-70 family)
MISGKRPLMASMQTDSLIEKAKTGDVTAQGRLVQLWYKRMYNFAFKFFADHDLAMEAAQKTFIAVHKNIEALQDVSRFKSWLYTIAANQCRDELRKRKSARTTSLNQVMGNGEGEQSPVWEVSVNRFGNPESKLLQHELADILQKALLKLPEEQREVLIMKEYEGLKFREIAEVLSISENTAKSRLYYGLESMRKILKQENINKETVGYDI